MRLNEALDLLFSQGYDFYKPSNTFVPQMLCELSEHDRDIVDDTEICELVKAGIKNAANDLTTHAKTGTRRYSDNDFFERDKTHAHASQINSSVLKNAGNNLHVLRYSCTHVNGQDGRFAALLKLGSDWFEINTDSIDPSQQYDTESSLQAFEEGKIGHRNYQVKDPKTGKLVTEKRPYIQVLTYYWLDPKHPDTALLAKLYPDLGINVDPTSPFINKPIERLYVIWSGWKRAKALPMNAAIDKLINVSGIRTPPEEPLPRAIDYFIYADNERAQAALAAKKEADARKQRVDQGIKSNLKKFKKFL